MKNDNILLDIITVFFGITISYIVFSYIYDLLNINSYLIVLGISFILLFLYHKVIRKKQ